MGQIVLADTSPVIYLAQVEGGLSWLKEIYGSVSVTPAVRRELLPAQEAPGKSEIQNAFRQGILREIEMPWSTPAFSKLDEGEESTIRAAVNLSQSGNTCLILIDDKDARQVLQTLRSGTLQSEELSNRLPRNWRSCGILDFASETISFAQSSTASEKTRSYGNP
jgi:predicted nucleic acid-binding protein